MVFIALMDATTPTISRISLFQDDCGATSLTLGK